MPSQVWADSFARAKAHLYGNLGPVPVLADNIESTLISDQLKQQRKNTSIMIFLRCYKQGAVMLTIYLI